MSIDNYTDRERELRCVVADLQAENNELRAKLAALEKQEPVAWLVYAKGSHRYCALTFDTNKVPDIYAGGDVIALYTAPGAAMNGGNHERS